MFAVEVGVVTRNKHLNVRKVTKEAYCKPYIVAMAINGQHFSFGGKYSSRTVKPENLNGIR